MSVADTLRVRTLAGLTLRLTQHRSRTLADDISASLFLPLTRAERAAGRVYGRNVAFLAGGTRNTSDVRIQERDERYPDEPCSLWLGGTAIDIDDATADIVRAWLDNLTPWTDDAPAHDTAPRTLPAPAAPEATA